ncbi:MAG TPA: hypothetical protein VGC41_25105 [Kofleriaceae bacterium]
MLALAACGKGDGKPGAGSAAAATPRDALLASWKTAGLAPSPFAAAKDSPVGHDCEAGTVNSVDVLVCNFASEADAKAAVDAGLKWVGDTTGISQPKGTLLIAAADRKKADPSGATINKLVKTAP